MVLENLEKSQKFCKRIAKHDKKIREGVKKNNYFFSSLLLLRGPATPPSPLSSPVDNLDFRSIF